MPCFSIMLIRSDSVRKPIVVIVVLVIAGEGGRSSFRSSCRSSTRSKCSTGRIVVCVVVGVVGVVVVVVV